MHRTVEPPGAALTCLNATRRSRAGVAAVGCSTCNPRATTPTSGVPLPSCIGTKSRMVRHVTSTDPDTRIRVLPTGAAGLHSGLERARIHIVGMRRPREHAKRVQSNHLGAVLAADVAHFTAEGHAEVPATGLPCTGSPPEMSATGAFERRSGSMGHALRAANRTQPHWITLENISDLTSSGLS